MLETFSDLNELRAAVRAVRAEDRLLSYIREVDGATRWAASVSLGAGPPGVVQLEPSDSLGIVWVDVPSPAPQAGPVSVSVRAGSGRFFWAGSPVGLLRIVKGWPSLIAQPALALRITREAHRIVMA